MNLLFLFVPFISITIIIDGSSLVVAKNAVAKLSMIHVTNRVVGLTGESVRRRASEGQGHDIKLELKSGSYSGTGQYFVPVKIGSPPQNFLLVPDTGSDLTWVRCQYQCHNCRGRTRRERTRRRFHADNSNTFKPIPCSSEMCRNLPFAYTDCPTQMSPCAYDYRYADQSWARGFFANDTVTVGIATGGGDMKIEQVPVGCSRKAKGVSADGVLALGFGHYSFARKAMDAFGGKFSYCLIDLFSPENISSYILFGSRQEYPEMPKMKYTQLSVAEVDIFYGVTISSISVGGVMLEIPTDAFIVAKGGGTIFDSGSTLSYLVKPVYDPVMRSLKSALSKFTLVPDEQLEFCFNSTGFHESMVPKLVFHFADAVEFEPPVKSYVFSAAEGVRCIGFLQRAFPGQSVFGNVLQQNHLWEFDLEYERLGFAPSKCT